MMFTNKYFINFSGQPHTALSSPALIHEQISYKFFK